MFEIIISLLVSWQTLEPNKTSSIDNINPNYTIVRLNSSRPFISARAGLVADLKTNTILYEKNSLAQLPIASLTKLMTALIILTENDLNEVVTITRESTQVGGASIYLRENQQITIKNLLKGMLIQSGNDAATALAIHNAGTVSEFVKKMNQKAKKLNLQNTSFANPTGFDDPNNYSTAQDLYSLAKTVYSFPVVQEIASIQETRIFSINNTLNHNLVNTNLILNNYLNISGLKTGTTSLAGGCFIGITNTTHPQITIILGSPNRFLDTKTMLDWAKNNFQYLNI